MVGEIRSHMLLSEAQRLGKKKKRCTLLIYILYCTCAIFIKLTHFLKSVIQRQLLLTFWYVIFQISWVLFNHQRE